MRAFWFWKLFLFILVGIICVHIAFGATLRGTIYSNNLDVVKDAVVTINTIPRQQFVAKEGEYEFQVPFGDYEIDVRYYNSYGEGVAISENISVTGEGAFTFDVIVFTDTGLEENIDLLSEEVNDTSQHINLIKDIQDSENKIFIYGAVLLMVLILIIIVMIAIKLKSIRAIKGAEIVQDDSANVLNYIKKEGGRVTQKMLREQFPFSEAKVSLIVTELEHKGIVEKIKKGKGNVILLKR
jgi:uncharacterized membrane protein